MSKRILMLLFVTFVVIGTVWAADNPFAGKWKLNPSRSTLFDEMKVAAAGANKYTFDFGGGNPETIVTDGTDQAGMFGTTLAVTVEGPRSWKVVRKKDGRMLVTGDWTLSEDGTKLTDHFTGFRADGSTTSMDYVYSRTGGGSGFAATWDSTTEQMNSVYEFQIQPYETDGLSIISPADKSTNNVRFDGKEYPKAGPNTPKGAATVGRRLDNGALEITDKIEGKVVDTRRLEVSSDQKTLTMTVQPVSQSKPNVLVFDRE